MNAHSTKTHLLFSDRTHPDSRHYHTSTPGCKKVAFIQTEVSKINKTILDEKNDIQTEGYKKK